MKYTLQWTDGNHKCWHLRKAAGATIINRKLRQLMPAVARKNGTHATLITITVAAK